MRSRLIVIGLLILALPSFAYAALININTADATLLDTLPGIGETKAKAIVDYRTQHGLFARIEDIQNVSGIGTGVTYTNIAPLITVGDTSVGETASSTTATSTPSITTFSGAATTYVPPPSTISIQINSEQDAVLEVPFRAAAQVTTKGGGVDSAAKIVWSFGDGSRGEGSSIEKTYRYPGTYLVTAIATDGSARARDEIIVTARPAQVRLLPVSGDGITVMNDSSERLDLSDWRLRADSGFFRIPEGTTILPKSGVLFPFTITNLPMMFDAALMYPSGIVAAYSKPLVASTTAVSVPPQLLPEIVSYKKVQKVESIISQATTVQSHEKGVLAPTAAIELAAVGAALPAPEVTTAPKPQSSGLFHSVWTLGLLGVIALAGGAFILL